MSSPIFITGTDTDSGKTYVTVRLLQWLQQQGVAATGVKPIASGATLTVEGLRNADALALMHASTRPREYAWHNPITFKPAIAPHIAAQEINQRLDAHTLLPLLQTYSADTGETLLIEGAGGWLLPLNARETLADVIVQLGWPVIMVVGMRLGCLNHALLTWRTLRQQGVRCLGWVANFLTPDMLRPDENLHTLIEHFGAPLAVFAPGANTPSSHQLDKLLT